MNKYGWRNKDVRRLFQKKNGLPNYRFKACVERIFDHLGIQLQPGTPEALCMKNAMYDTLSRLHSQERDEHRRIFAGVKVRNDDRKWYGYLDPTSKKGRREIVQVQEKKVQSSDRCLEDVAFAESLLLIGEGSKRLKSWKGAK